MDRDLSLITILISHERSGSHVFASYLGSNPALQIVDEVCNIDAMSPKTSPLSYFSFVQRRILEGDERIISPGVPSKSDFVAEFLEFLSLKSSKRTVVDIKYNHLHNFEGHWSERWAKPLLFKVAEQTGVRFIHLRRRTPANAIISALVAEHNKVWHVKSGESRELEPVSIDLKAFARNYDQLARTIAFVERRIAPIPCLSLYYEDLLIDGEFTSELGKEIGAFLGIQDEFSRQPALQKMSKNLEQIVANYAAIKAYCNQKEIALG